MFKITDNLRHYNNVQKAKFEEQIKEFSEITGEVVEKIKAVREKKFKVVEDSTLSNDITIAPNIIVDFENLLKGEFTVQQGFDNYDKWFEQLYKLFVVNEPWFRHKKLMEHMMKILAICASFEAFVKEVNSLST